MTRPFLEKLALAAAALALSLGAPATARAQFTDFEKYKNGDNAFAKSKDPENCISCHHAAPPLARIAEDEDAHDVIVVGAGIAGLSAAWRLRDVDALLLDKDQRAGGKMMSRAWEGIEYSDGPAYFVDYEGDVKDLLDGVGLKPIPVPETTNAVVIGGKIYYDPWLGGVDALPYSKEAKQRLTAAFKLIQELNANRELAVPARESSPRMLELDKVKAIDYFEPYGEEMKAILATYIRSCFGVEPDELSALGFLNFFAAEFGPTYSFPGGLAAVTDAIARKLDPKRVRMGCFVTKVSAQKDGVRVSYTDGSGKQHVARAKAVVLAVPQFAACNLIEDLEKNHPERYQLMRSIYHGAYAVAAIKTKTPVHDGVYDTWFLDGWKDGTVTDVIVADWVARGGKPADPKRKHVLTAYMPLGTAGRSEFLDKPITQWKDEFVKQLTQRFPSLPEQLVDVDVFLHAHAMHVTVPGYLTVTAPKLGEPLDGRILMAGVELDLPQLESAVWSGYRAAAQARCVLEGKPFPKEGAKGEEKDGGKQGATPPPAPGGEKAKQGASGEKAPAAGESAGAGLGAAPLAIGAAVAAITVGIVVSRATRG